MQNSVFFAFLASILFCGKFAFAETKNKVISTCPPGEHWVKAHSQNAYTRSEGTLVSGSYHKAHCQKNPPAYAIWHNRLKSGLPPNWEFKNEKPKTWTEAEKEKMLNALSVIPPGLLLTNIEGIYRLSISKEVPTNPAANHDNQIAVYDEAFKLNQNLAQIVAHEFAHNLYRQTSDADKISYAKNTYWTTIEEISGGFRLVPGRKGFVEEDGQISVEEDFCNNVEYFLFHPKTLKDKTPSAFEWLNKKYGDKLKLGNLR